jgi:hypothetical protein
VPFSATDALSFSKKRILWYFDLDAEPGKPHRIPAAGNEARTVMLFAFTFPIQYNITGYWILDTWILDTGT